LDVLVRVNSISSAPAPREAKLDIVGHYAKPMIDAARFGLVPFLISRFQQLNVLLLLGHKSSSRVFSGELKT
jgi:hypothetical protein